MSPIYTETPYISVVVGVFGVNSFSVLKSLDGTQNSDRYQKGIFGVVNILCKCLILPRKGFIFQNDLAPCHNSKSTKYFFDAQLCSSTFVAWK